MRRRRKWKKDEEGGSVKMELEVGGCDLKTVSTAALTVYISHKIMKLKQRLETQAEKGHEEVRRKEAEKGLKKEEGSEKV